MCARKASGRLTEKSWTAGFTLVELAVVLVIISIVTSGAMLGFAQYANNVKAQATQERFNVVLNSLSSYVQRNYRLPCPADPSAVGANMGVERDNGRCVKNTDLYTMYSEVEGIVPWRTLGLPESAARDGWGRYIIYKPAPGLTADNYSPYMQNTVGAAPSGDPDIHDACRTPMWFDASGHFVDRRKALFCCNAMPKDIYLTGPDGMASGNMPLGWREPGIVSTAAAAGGGSAYAYGQTSPPLTTAPAAITNAWMDDPTLGNFNGSFGSPLELASGKAVPPMIRATGLAVTLISHGGNGFLSFLRDAAAGALQEGSEGATSLTTSAAMSNAEKMNVWPPQVAEATAYNPKTSGKSYDPTGRMRDASDDMVVYLRTDQLMNRIGDATCLHPANAGTGSCVYEVGQCGAAGSVASRTPPAPPPANNLCAVGSASGVTFIGSLVPPPMLLWSWTCKPNCGSPPVSCSAPRIVDGGCGAANVQDLLSKPTLPTPDLCAAGIPSAVTATAGPGWSWSCGGVNGGNNSPACAAYQIVNGACGGGTDSCTAGTAAGLSDNGTTTRWTCLGINGGSNAACTVPDPPPPINGACGGSAGACAAGMPTAPSDDGTDTTWTCLGSAGGSNSPPCSVPDVVNGACASPPDGAILGSAPTRTLCASGTASGVSGTGPWSWNCSGSGGGTTASCSASLAAGPVNGACASPPDGATLGSAPTGTLCDSGTASGVSGTGPWSWSCSGSGGGTTAPCSASIAAGSVSGACASPPNAATLSSAPTGTLCDSGTASGVSGTGPWSWNCSGSGGGTTAPCSASIAAGPVNGACASPPNAATLSSAPTGTLCASGTASAVSGVGPFGPWSWNCSGSGGGSTASCRTTITVVAGVCGPDAGQTFKRTPSVGLCSTGTASPVGIIGLTLSGAKCSPTTWPDCIVAPTIGWICASSYNGGLPAPGYVLCTAVGKPLGGSMISPGAVGSISAPGSVL